MKKVIISMLVLVALATSLSAQITREKADEIVLEYIQNEVTPPYLLYVNVHSPNMEGITITTFQEEKIKIKYACWVYYLNENPYVNGTTQHRYLFVKEDDGNLLEVITTNDLGADVTTDWILVDNTGLVDLKENGILIYPNPTRGELIVKSEELKVENIEIYDVVGKKLLTLNSQLLTQIDLRQFPAGVYFIHIQTTTGTITQKIIKN
jgi:hypothetical protein